MVYEGYKIYGPYKSSVLGRLQVIAYRDGKRKTITYPKYLMEVHLNRYLSPTETVDHIDGDLTNNNLSNLQVLDRIEHLKLDSKRLVAQEFTCVECGAIFIREGDALRYLARSAAQGKAGPFCSRRCRGLYGQRVQMGGALRPAAPTIVKEYTTNKILARANNT